MDCLGSPNFLSAGKNMYQPIGKPSCCNQQKVSFKDGITDTFNSTLKGVSLDKSTKSQNFLQRTWQNMKEGYPLLNPKEVLGIIWEAVTGKNKTVRNVKQLNHAA